jgi:hypothetical protein
MLVGGGLLAGMKSTVQEFARIGDLSKRFDESSESLQRVGHAAEQSGTDLEMVAKAMSKLTITAGEAAAGNKESAATFSDLGINAAEFIKMPMEEKLKALAQAYETSNGDAEQLTKVMALVGVRMQDLLPMLSEGKTGLDALFKDAPVLADEAVAAIARADDAIAKMNRTLKVSAGWLMGAFGNLAGAAGSMSTGETSEDIEAEKRNFDPKRLRAIEEAATAEKAKQAEIKRKQIADEKEHLAIKEEIAKREKEQSEYLYENAETEDKVRATIERIDQLQEQRRLQVGLEAEQTQTLIDKEHQRLETLNKQLAKEREVTEEKRKQALEEKAEDIYDRRYGGGSARRAQDKIEETRRRHALESARRIEQKKERDRIAKDAAAGSETAKALAEPKTDIQKTNKLNEYTSSLDALVKEMRERLSR